MNLERLFFVHHFTSTGKKGSRIGFVLPRSIFTADQHHNFRATTFSNNAIHQTGITEVWDLEKVSPLFNVPSCVVFGTRPHLTKKPIHTEVLNGELNKEKRNVSLEEAKKHITKRETGLYVVKQGERSYWAEDPKAEFSASSPYASKFKDGATIYPRSFWFVEIPHDEKLGFSTNEPFLISDHRAIDEAKDNYKDVRLEGRVEREFIHARFLSTDLLPFGHLDYRIVVLPVKKSGHKYAFFDASELNKNGYTKMAKWVENCQSIWEEKRKEKAKRQNVLEWLDHRRKLSQQEQLNYRVLYPTSATYLCSAVLQKEEIKVKIGEQTLRLNSFAVDHKLFYYDTDDKNEAYFLCSILNSKIIDTLIKPMQSKGLWGPRDIHKKVWELPIPIYSESKSTHRELTELGIDCSEKVKKFLPELETKDITPGKIGRLRSEVRERLSDELKEIDGIVKKVMEK